MADWIRGMTAGGGRPDRGGGVWEVRPGGDGAASRVVEDVD